MFEVSEIIKAIILGFVQGATEFIPVSSSGHLVIIPWLFGWEPSGLLFDAILHWGTLVAILIIFRGDFANMIGGAWRNAVGTSQSDSSARLVWLIILATMPAATVGFLMQESIEGLFASTSAPLVAGSALLMTAGLLAASERLTQRAVQLHKLDNMSTLDAFLIGLAQMVALLPGVSRSGSTIAAGLTRGLRRDAAARFSFLLGTPVFFGAGLLQLLDALDKEPTIIVAQLPVLLVGFTVSAVTGFLAIRFLLAYLRTNNLYIFSVYCAIAGLSVIAISSF